MDFGNRYDRLFVAMVLPYRKGTFEPDEEGLRRLIRTFLQPTYVEAGIALIVNPEAGEVFYLDRATRRRLVEVAADEVAGRVPLFAGVIEPSTMGTIISAEDALKAGAEGLFVLPPIGAGDITVSWNAREYPEVWIDMVKAIVDRVGEHVPIICHPTASLSMAYGNGFPLESTIRMLEKIPNIVGWKMTYNYDGYRAIARALRNFSRHVAILAAPAVYFHENLASNQFDGTVSGSFNYALEPMVEHITAWRRGDVTTAWRIWESGLAELHEYVYADFSRLHIRYKTATWLRGWIPDPFMMPPMPLPRRAEVERLYTLLKNAGLSVLERSAVDELLRGLPG